MKGSLTTIVLIAVVLIASYLIGALPGYLWYYFRKALHKIFLKDFVLLIIPFLLYIGLVFIEDRQGFSVPATLVVIGLSVSVYFILCTFFPRIHAHPLAITALIGCVLLCWIFYPASRMKMI